MTPSKNKDKKPSSKDEIESIKSDFINSMSHELRTPLSVIKQCIDIVEDETSGPLSTVQKGFLETAQKSVERLTHFINEVLDFQAYDRSDFKINTSKTDINGLIEKTKETFEAFAKAKSLELNIELDKTLPKVNVDSEKIEKVLAHYLENALTYSDSGKITVKSAQKNNHLEITVEDEGIGIKEEVLPKLFYSFSHLLNGENKHTRRAGLGLATCKKIVERHKGKTGVHSVYGQGSTFYFTLPLPQIKK